MKIFDRLPISEQRTSLRFGDRCTRTFPGGRSPIATGPRSGYGRVRGSLSTRKTRFLLPHVCLCSGFPPSSTMTSIGGSILIDDPSPYSRAPGAGTSSVFCVGYDAAGVCDPQFLEQGSPDDQFNGSGPLCRQPPDPFAANPFPAEASVRQVRSRMSIGRVNSWCLGAQDHHLGCCVACLRRLPAAWGRTPLPEPSRGHGQSPP